MSRLPTSPMRSSRRISARVRWFSPRQHHFFQTAPFTWLSLTPVWARLAARLHLRTGNQYFVGPDNGIFSWVLKQSENRVSTFEAVALDKPAYWLPLISRSFHGRDIFAPVAAHLANGRLLSELGTPIFDLVQIPFPMPVRTSNGWLGEIISIDHFGNLITNLQEHHIKSKERATLILGEFTINGISETFGSNTLGDLMAMIDSSGQLSVAVARGNAAKQTKAKVGDPLELLDSTPGSNRPH